MRPGRPGDGTHARFQALLVRSLDERLEARESARLAAHLAACPVCRTVAAGYREDRARLRGLRRADPPRDLWARTETALDREVLKGDHRPAAVSLGTLAGLAAVLALIGSQVGSGGSTPSAAPGATPFAITPQSLAFLTRDGNELALFRTQINEVCPPPLLDCPQSSSTSESVVRVGADIDPSGLAVGADGRVLITGRDEEGHAVFGIVRLDESLAEPSSDGRSPGSGATATDASATPSGTRATAGATRSATPFGGGSSRASATAGGSGAGRSPDEPRATASATSLPDVGDLPEVRPILSDVIQTGSPAAWSPDGSSLAFSAMPADGSHGPDVYVWSPGDDVAVALTDDHRSSFASWVDDEILISRVEPADGEDGASPGSGHRTGADVSPDPDASPEADVSPDPDASPEPGDHPTASPKISPTPRPSARRGGGATDEATASPKDKASPSPKASPNDRAPADGRASPTDRPSGDAAPTPHASVGVGRTGTAAQVVTVLLDPLTRREVSIPALEGAWLPTVDPVGRYVAYWQGVLAWDGQTVAPVSGRLWIGSWPAIEPRAQPIPTPTPDGDRGRPSPTPRPSQTAAPATAVRWPLDPAAGTVVDWRIRWADDGLAVGLWLAASPDARVGQLTVLTPPDPRTQEASVLLAPTPAGEGAFAMGLDRVAWVVPLGTAAGELRVATWGPLGSGGVRLRQLDGLGVPAF